MKILLSGIILALSASAIADETQTRAQAYQSIQALTNATKALAQADLSCKDAVDCTVIGLGDRACGGVSEYMIASLKNANIEEIQYLANRTQEREAEYNGIYAVISICSIEMPPAFACNEGTCQAK